MSLISVLPDKLCEWFSDMNEFADCSFCTQFPVNSKTTPLEAPVVVFGADSLAVLDNTTDETGTIITDSRISETKFSIGIHIPRNQGGVGCYTLFDSILELLLFNTSIAISGVTTENIEYIRNTDSLYLKVVFVVTETIEKSSASTAAFTL